MTLQKDVHRDTAIGGDFWRRDPSLVGLLASPDLDEPVRSCFSHALSVKRG